MVAETVIVVAAALGRVVDELFIVNHGGKILRGAKRLFGQRETQSNPGHENYALIVVCSL